jgi:glutathione S-transferase
MTLSESQRNSLPVLYSFRRCPYAIRARMALRYAGIELALREVVLRDKPEDMLRRSPKGTVPVLVLERDQADEQVIDESLAIMRWALAQNDKDQWLALDSTESHALIEANDNDFKHWLDRYKYPDRYTDIGSEDPAAHCRQFAAGLDERLAQHQYLFGDRISIGDIAIFPFIRQYAFVDINQFRAGSMSSLNRWLEEWLASDLFVGVMQKYPAWKPDDSLTIF